MGSESPDTEHEITAAPVARVAGPVLFSVFLHGVVLALFAHSAFAPAEARKPEPPNIRIALVTRPLPRVPQPPQGVEASPAPVIVEEPQETPPTVEVLEPAVENVAEVAPVDDETEVPAEPVVPVWSPSRIRAAIQTTTGDRQSRFTDAWVTDCILERKEEGTRDCEQQQEEQGYLTESTRAGIDAGEGAFAGITRPQRYARVIEQFGKENALFESLMEETGRTGAMAAERYFLNREYLLYLSGNGQDPMFFGMGNFRTDPLGGPRLLLPGDIPFRCKDHCDDLFTVFNIERPEVEPEEGKFRVVPTLLGTPR